LADDLVGISHECDYPEAIRNKPVVVRPAVDPEHSSSLDIDRQVRVAVEAGHNLYALDETLFARTQPDLVITQDLCHVCAVTPDQLHRAIGALPTVPRLLTLNPKGLDDILRDIERIGTATGREDEGRALVSQLRQRLTSVRDTVRGVAYRPKVACLEWLDPLYAAGHWVPEMVEWAGGRDVLTSAGAPSMPVTWEAVHAAAPDVVVLMPCGFSIDRTWRELDRVTAKPGWDTLPAVQQHRVFAVDASSYFSRPGPRLIEGVGILAALCHPTLFGGTISRGARRVTAHEHRAV
jgi:iron complex transport system substrate-binding protein